MSSSQGLRGVHYVAMGSSFAAGPGVGRRAPGTSRLCQCSNDNYAHVLARMRGLTLADVSCSGATAQQVLDGGPYRQPPQVNALRPETALVTLTVGGNDLSYIGNLLAWSRRDAPQQTPLLWRLLLPKPTPDAEVDHAITTLPSRLLRIAETVRRRAPQATLIFVDYAVVIPESDEHEGHLPLRDVHVQRGRYVAHHLADSIATAAQQADALLVRASEVTRGHDMCAADPWMQGYVLPSNPFRSGPLAYHPNARGMRAVAEAIDAALPPQVPVP